MSSVILHNPVNPVFLFAFCIAETGQDGRWPHSVRAGLALAGSLTSGLRFRAEQIRNCYGLARLRQLIHEMLETLGEQIVA
jgi:hypothetical protein